MYSLVPFTRGNNHQVVYYVQITKDFIIILFVVEE